MTDQPSFPLVDRRNIRGGRRRIKPVAVISLHPIAKRRAGGARSHSLINARRCRQAAFLPRRPMRFPRGRRRPIVCRPDDAARPLRAADAAVRVVLLALGRGPALPERAEELAEDAVAQAGRGSCDLGRGADGSPPDEGTRGRDLAAGHADEALLNQREALLEDWRDTCQPLSRIGHC